MELTEHQAARVEALRFIRRGRFVGAAGTGKSTVAIHLPRLLGWSGNTVFVAPTHTAVRILQGKATEAGVRIDVRTVDSVVRMPPRVLHCPGCDPKTQSAQGNTCPHLDPDRPPCPHAMDPDLRCGRLTFRSADPRPFWDDFENVIVDESSMLSPELFRLLEAGASRLSGRILYVGDHCQLPPVLGEKERREVGEDWCCLRSVAMPEVKLIEVHRQAEGSAVLDAATALRDVIDPQVGAPFMGKGTAVLDVAVPAGRLVAADVVRSSWSRDWTSGPQWVQGLATAMRADPFGYVVLVSTHQQRVFWNGLLRGGRTDPAVGDLVMASHNEPSKGVSKWVRGTIKRLAEARGGWLADIELETGRTVYGQAITSSSLGVGRPGEKRVTWIWGNALTVHASQGAGYGTVIYVPQVAPGSQACITANHAYTAITRARTTLVVVEP